MVFLGGDRALKIKRAVSLPFLDYSTLEKRKRACEEELKVNAGNAPELYRRVVAITRNSDGAFEIDGTGTPVEWAVEMTRFDESSRSIFSRHRGRSIHRLRWPWPMRFCGPMTRRRAPTAKAGSPPSHPSSNAIPQSFSTVRGFDAVAIDQLDAASRDAATRLQPLLRARASRGFVRRCHGDLHLANIALVDGRPLLFDAIEFDPVIATTDILYDLAFTLMDLVHFNQPAAANAVFNRYLAEAEDEGLDGLRLLPLFLSVRAAIRAHVLFMKSEQARRDEAVWQEAKRYFDLAGRLIMPKPPLLVAIGGLSGTGKSVLARGLAGLIEPPPGAVIIRSDVVRKHLFGVGETTALPESAYRADVTERVYGLLSSTAQRILAQGCSVVLDAAYLQEAERAEIAALQPLTAFALSACSSPRISRPGWRGSNIAGAMRPMQHGMLS